MNVLLIGSGGRENAIANALAKSPLLTRLYVAPGNPGTERVAENVDLDAGDHGAVLRFCKDMGIALVVVGPEQPLIGGLVDALTRAGVLAFGPTQAAAQLEGSKGFTKDLCRDYGIPTAAYARFRQRTTRSPMSARRARPSSSRRMVSPPARASSSRRRWRRRPAPSKPCSPGSSANPAPRW